MTAREELAAVLHALECGCVDYATDDDDRHYAKQADALLASPALARAIREAKADGWDEGHLDDCLADPTRCANHLAANPYREGGA